MTRFTLFFVLFLGLITSGNIVAQEVADTNKKKEMVLVIKSDGNEFYGEIISDDGREILMMTKTIGKVYIAKADIREIRKVEEGDVLAKSGVHESGPLTTRYAFTANAMPVKKGDHYAMIHLPGPEVHFAMSDKFSLGIMTSWIGAPFIVAGKYSLYSDGDKHLSLGSMLGSSLYIANASAHGGLHWMTFTKGSRTSNISLSAGFAHLNTGTMWGRYLGEKYSFQAYDQGMPYYVDPDAHYAIHQEVYAGVNWPDNYLKRRSVKSVVLGIGGITGISKKSSFIFDSMIFVYRPQEARYSNMDVTVTYTDNTTNQSKTGTFVIGSGYAGYSENTKVSVMFMPGMRFSTSHDKAFQFAVAGILDFENGNVSSAPFPIPMISWLRKI